MLRTMFTRRSLDQVARTTRVVEHRRRQLDFARNRLKANLRPPVVAIALVGSASLLWWLSRRSTVHPPSNELDLHPQGEADTVTDTNVAVLASPQRSKLSVVLRLTSSLLTVVKIVSTLRRALALSGAGSSATTRRQTTPIQ
jgi:hypothetical protein